MKQMQLSFEGQVLAADTETRTIKGLVVPFAKVGNTSAGPVRFEFGAFGEIDPSQIVLNMEHDRTRPLGRGIAGSEEITPAGISMAFKIAPTGAGNDALVEASEGLRPAFSIEANVGEYTIEKGVMVVSAAKLEAVAHVTNPAFKDAQMYVNSVIDTSIGSRPAIDAIGSRAITASGMVISHPKITTSGTVADTNEGAAPSETGIVSSYVNLDVNKFAGMQRYSVELLERSSPDFFQAMVDNSHC